MKKLLLIFLFPWAMLSQEVLVEKTPPDYIKTIIFKADGNDKNQFPIVRRNESFSLQFDDLGGNEETYYYKITHCNADWSASSLMKSEYLKGLTISRYSLKATLMAPYRVIRTTDLLFLMNLPN